MDRRLIVPVAMGVWLVLGACQSGEVVEVDRTVECRRQSVSPLALDQPSPSGLTGRDLLRLAGGAHELPIEWQSGYRGADRLRVEVEPMGDARFVDREPRASGCVDQVEVDVRVRLVTADGGIDEVFPSTLAAETSDLAWFHDKLDEAARGRVWQPQAGQPMPAWLAVSTWFTPRGMYGAIGTQGPSVAVWPFKSLCTDGIPILNEDVEPSIDDLLRPFLGPATLWRDQEPPLPITLTQRRVERGACFIGRRLSLFDAGLPEALVDAGLEALVDVDLVPRTGPALTLHARAHGRIRKDGTLAVVGLGGTYPCADGLTVDEFRASCGDWGVDLRPYRSAHIQLEGVEQKPREFAVVVYGDNDGTQVKLVRIVVGVGAPEARKPPPR